MNTPKPYEHTQIGWLLLALFLLPVLALIPLAMSSSAPAAVMVVLMVMVVTAALFASLTVRVDDQRISWKFGIGLLRGQMDLANVLAFKEVENPWYWGLGIRWYPGGKLYNVSGHSAVELVLRNHERVRVGTDEPQALCSALEAKLGPSLPLSELLDSQDARRRKGALAAISVTLTLLIGLFLLFRVEAQPPVVTVTPTAITIESLFYGESYPVENIQKIALIHQLPRIRIRTNGYAAFGTLRGRFRLDQLGPGKLFVEIRHPPFIIIHLTGRFVCLNYAEPAQTERLFGELRQRFPELVAPAVSTAN